MRVDTSELAGDRPDGAQLTEADLSDELLLEKLRGEMHEDFSEQRTANLYGWFVSRTEARIFAAIARLVE